MAHTAGLAGQVAVVTGASRGIGAALCHLLAAEGVHLACAARSTAERPNATLGGALDEVVADARGAGVDAIAIPTDLTRPDDIENMVTRTVEHFGRADILVNNAGMTLASTLETPVRRYERVIEVNLTAPYLAMRAALPALRASGGRILNVSSAAALNVYPATMAYGVAKIGLERMTVDVAEQLRRDGIAANCFRIDVAVASEGFKANVPESTYDAWEPPEIPAEGMLWILSQPTSYTGQLLSLTGLRAAEGIMASRSREPYAPLAGVVDSWAVGLPDATPQLSTRS